MVDKKYWIWLASLPGIGSKRFSALMAHFETAQNVFDSTGGELIKSGILSRELVDTVVSNRNLEKIDKYLKKVQENDIKVYTIDEDEYPENLKNIYDPPPIIYVKGELKAEDNLAIGIVGSRKASDYGLKTAEKLAVELAEAGITVVSGLALGIDSAAHRGALKAKGRTIAVFACGLNHVYPVSAVDLSREIIKNGALISEYPIGMKAMPPHFPARNRIISGMSLGALIVEAAERSGSLITSDFALEQGRDVFAIPGNINAPGSKGTNNLIKNGAKLVDSVEDILQELNLNMLMPAKEQKISTKRHTISLKAIDDMEDADDIEKAILRCLLTEGKSTDGLILVTGYTAGAVISAITMLELKGLIEQTGGNYYLSQHVSI